MECDWLIRSKIVEIFWVGMFMFFRNKFPLTYLVIVLVGVRICEIFSKKSSLNERARRANLVPRKLPLWPEEPGYPPDDGVIVPLSQSAKKRINNKKDVS